MVPPLSTPLYSSAASDVYKRQPIEGRICAIADVFDALTSKRPYKDAWSIEKTVDFLQSQKGKHFEPRLVDLMIEIMPKILDIKATFKDED